MEVFMKRISLFLSVFILLLASETTFAQTASDYYLSLSVGSHVNLYTAGGDRSYEPYYSDRTTTYTIEGTDLISGQQCFKEVDREYSSTFSDTFNIMWFRKDSVGNVVLGAMSTTGSPNIDSATVVNGIMFPNEFLTKGYSRTYNILGNTGQDSVLSITETVNVPAGIYTNCLKIAQTSYNGDGTIYNCDYNYYAYGVGLVKSERTLPVRQAHTDELISFGTTGVSDGAVNQTPLKCSLSQNYPNPFNPSTVISYQVASFSKISLKVFDLMGREVATLVNEVKSAGSYTATFNAANMPSGVYFYRLQAGSFTETKRLVLLK
jgi:Secretion system C-terminal sorting domain